jgi:hypothetical protein
LHLEVEQLQDVPESERWTQARLIAQEEAGRPFDLSREVFRVRLVQCGEVDYLALLTMHHIVGDAWSMSVLINEVAALYRAFSRGERSTLPDLEFQYADYAVWQREWMQDGVLAAELEYWRRQLGGKLSVLELPTDHPRPAVQNYSGAAQMFKLPATLTTALKELSQREGCTLFMTLLAAFQTLLHRYSKQKEIVVGTDIANRNRAEIEPLIGFFINQLVLRTDFSRDPSFLELLRRVRENSLGAFAHQNLPFERIVEELQPERDSGRTPLFQVKFVLQNASNAKRFELPGLTLTQLESAPETAKFDLLVNVAETGGEIGCSWQYRTELFEAETIERMQGQFERLLESIVREPEARVSALEWELAAEVAAQEQRQAEVAESLRRVVAAATASERCGWRVSWKWMRWRKRGSR